MKRSDDWERCTPRIGAGHARVSGICRHVVLIRLIREVRPGALAGCWDRETLQHPPC
jgi:hypothetical protein